MIILNNNVSFTTILPNGDPVKHVYTIGSELDDMIRSLQNLQRIERAKSLARTWITANCCDGEDRKDSGNADTHKFNSPDLYELAEDIAEFLVEEKC